VQASISWVHERLSAMVLWVERVRPSQ
jgi:hypothetical protein